MKPNHLLVALLLVLAGGVMRVHAQPTEAERKDFASVQARANKGDVEAQLLLATYYTQGIGVTASPKKAVQALRQAALQGSAIGQYRLGLKYLDGEGVKLSLIHI